MTGAGPNHNHQKIIDELNERHRLVTNELRHAERELDDTRRYRTTLQHIAAAKSGIWGEYAADALYPDRRAPPPAA